MDFFSFSRVNINYRKFWKEQYSYSIFSWIETRFQDLISGKYYLIFIKVALYVMQSSKMSLKSKNMIFVFLAFSIRVLFRL